MIKICKDILISKNVATSKLGGSMDLPDIAVCAESMYETMYLGDCIRA